MEAYRGVGMVKYGIFMVIESTSEGVGGLSYINGRTNFTRDAVNYIFFSDVCPSLEHILGTLVRRQNMTSTRSAAPIGN